MNGRAVVDLKAICERLNSMAGDLARELLPRGSREGHYWRDAKVARGGLGDSLKVNTRTGRWQWYAHDQHGDMLDLYVLVSGQSKVDAIKWARDRLGISGAPPAHARAELDRARAEAERRRREREAVERQELEKKRAAAKAKWLEAEPQLLGTPVQLYLEARGIELKRLVDYGWGLQSLRFARTLKHPFANARMPALVALCIFPDGRTASLHRTYLVQRHGTWDRMRQDRDGHEGKLLYCPIHGGVIPLWRGSRLSARGTGEVLRGHAYSDPLAGPELDLIEGIENGLTCVQLDVDRRLACTVSLSNVMQLQLPKHYSSLTWIRDNDAAGSAADRLLERALEKLGDMAEEVYLVEPPAGAKDFNDGLKPANNKQPVPLDDRRNTYRPREGAPGT